MKTMNTKENLISRIYEQLEKAAEQQLILKESVFSNFEREVRAYNKRQSDTMPIRELLLQLSDGELFDILSLLEYEVEDYVEEKKNELFIVPEFVFRRWL